MSAARRRLRREQILDAALEEFAELGLHGASTDEIRVVTTSRSPTRQPAVREPPEIRQRWHRHPSGSIWQQHGSSSPAPVVWG
jgi:hypothetical protein